MLFPQLLQPRAQPNRSIKLQDCQTNPQMYFECSCGMCNHYQSKKIGSMMNERKKDITTFLSRKIHEKNDVTFQYYEWVIRRLLVPHNKIVLRNCDVFIPEICFYRDGEANCLFYDRELHDTTLKKTTKITNTLLQKIFNERRRKYRDEINKDKVVFKKKSVFAKKEVKKETKDAVVVRFDGIDQLMSEYELINLLSRRKQDPIWKKIDYIKNYVPAIDELRNIIFVKYVIGEPKYDKLFNRAETIAKISAQNIHEGDSHYISVEQETQFMKDVRDRDPSIFAEYTLYKIISFIQTFYDEKISKISAKILVDQLGDAYLIQVYSLKTASLVKYDWNNTIYLNKIEEAESRLINKEVPQQKETDQATQKLENTMLQEYERLKDKYGISLEQQDNGEQKANNKFFSFLYPNFKQDLSEILKQNISISQFRREYLGEPEVKKPVARPFNSHMVKTLHHLAPKLKVAKPHIFQRQDTSFMGRTDRGGVSFISRKKTFSVMSKTINSEGVIKTARN